MKTKVHSWGPRFPGVACRDCGVNVDDVMSVAETVPCPLCDAPAGKPCTTSPTRDGDEPHPTPPHAARMREAGALCGGGA